MSIATTIKRCVTLLSTVALTAAAFAGIATTAQADEMQPSDYKVVSALHKTGIFYGTKISGNIDVSKTFTATPAKVIDGATTYAGSIDSSVEAADLFEGAYELYASQIQGKGIGNLKWENIVMSTKTTDNQPAFPNFTYTVTFPANFTVDVNNITISENTSTISSITKSDFDTTHRSITFTFNLGNWNDYREFFAMVATERGQSGHAINIHIPYTATSPNSDSALGAITGEGKCTLYKFWKLQGPTAIVDISSPSQSFTITKE